MGEAMTVFGEIRKFRLPQITVTTCGLLPVLLGGLVLLGWYLKNKTLIQVSPEFVPMQYNTALGFVVGGSGLLFAQLGKRVGVRIFGGIGLAVGLLTLAEYVFGIDLAIDQLIMEHYITVATSHPGRMAPNTALCFSLTSIALLVASEAREKPWGLQAIAVLGSLVFGLGVVAFSGYAMRLETAYGWGHLTRMAVHTSAGFIVLGTGLFWHAWCREKATLAVLPHWVPAPVGIVILTVTLSLWQALDHEEIASHLILVLGVILSGALVYTVKLAQGLRQRASELEQEVNERAQAERRLEHGQANLERAIEERTHALRQKTELLSTVFESMEQGVAAFDKDLRLISANDRYGEIRGFPRELIETGRPFTDFVRHDVERKEFGEGDPEQIFNEKLALAGKFERHEFERRRPDGTFIEVCGGPVPGGGFVSTYTDITKRKQAEEELRKLSHAVEQSPASVYITDPTGNIEYVNPKFTEVTGYTADEAIGRNPSILKSGRMPREDYKNLWRSITAGREWRGELLNRKKDGSEYWESGTITPIVDGAGTITHFLAVKEDITERKRAETELSEKMVELERFSKVAVGRELRMIELKEKINALQKQLGREPEYEIVE